MTTLSQTSPVAEVATPDAGVLVELLGWEVEFVDPRRPGWTGTIPIRSPVTRKQAIVAVAKTYRGCQVIRTNPIVEDHRHE